jgi:DNA-binding beta-propeller fold protein YncE
MRMKFNKSGQLLLVSAASLLAAGLVTACGSNTVDFVYVTSSTAAGTNNYGEVDVLEVNRVSGYMRPIPTSPFPSGGRNPVAEAVSSDNANLYVVNRDDNTIVQFLIGSDGKIYPESTVNTPGIFPLAVAVNGSNLFVVDTFQPLPSCSTEAPCSGSVAVYPITITTSSSDNGALSSIPNDALGTPVTNGSLNYWPLALSCSSTNVLVPTAVNVLASGYYVYVTAYDSTAAAADSALTSNACDATDIGGNLIPGTAPTGYVFGFSITPSTSTVNPGALSAVSGSPFVVGTVQTSGTTILPHPSAIASDPQNRYVYITDSVSDKLHTYSVASGVLSEVSGSPSMTGGIPTAIVVDPSGSYAYVTNSQDSTITGYAIGNGVFTSIGTYATGLQPVAIGIDPSTSHYLYTVNFLGSNVSGFQLNSTDGTLINTQRSPYTTNTLPTALVAIPHGGSTM